MLLVVLAFAGGALTIASPCILPVLPFVFARADRPFARSGLPMLAGMAATFALVATLAAVGGGWAVAANRWGRAAALVLLVLFGLALLFPRVSERITEPVVRLGNRLSAVADRADGGAARTVLASALLGVATGCLWAPCAGPVLGLILTGAALRGASAGTTVLLLLYALGAAASLALALLAGGRVFRAMKRSLGAGEWLRRGLGVAVLGAVAVIGSGLDTGFLARVSLASTAGLEQGLVDRVQGGAGPAVSAAGSGLGVEGTMPSFAGATTWLNSPPLTAASLRGKVVLVDFWTYSCINCLRSLPYTEAWAAKYARAGLVVIGVHAPKFAFEKDVGNVRAAVARLGVSYPVAIDDDYAIWRGFGNEYWPALYFIDGSGRIRHHQFGEGDDGQSEAVIQSLLRENGARDVPGGTVSDDGGGATRAADVGDEDSPETYVGYERAENFNSPAGRQRGAPYDYRIGALEANEWGLVGNWTVDADEATANAAGGAIGYRFHARDLHLVLGVPAGHKPVRFVVTVDGQAPGRSHGADTAADGSGVVRGQRLYQLVRQDGAVRDEVFTIRFLDPGVHAYAFTFG